MKSRINNIVLLLCVLFLGTAVAGAQTTTFTGTLKDLSGATVTSGKFIFTPQAGDALALSGVQHYIGTPITCKVTVAGIKANDGVSACTVPQNTALQPAGTYYQVDECPYNACTARYSIYATTTTMDLSNMVSTPASSPIPNLIDNFSNQSIGGNKTFTGSLVASTINNVVVAVPQAGVDASVTVNNCIAAAIASGSGICDASGLGTQSGLTQQIFIGSSPTPLPVKLIVPAQGTWSWSTNLGSGKCAIRVGEFGSLMGHHTGVGGGFAFRGASGFSADAVLCTDNPIGINGGYFNIQDVAVEVYSGATVTVAGTWLRDMADLTVAKVYTFIQPGATAPKGLYVTGGDATNPAGYSCCSAALKDIGVGANNNAGTTPAVFGDGTTNISDINVFGWSFVGPGPGLPALLVTGGLFTGNINFYGGYSENGGTWDTTTPFWKINPSVNGVISFFGGKCWTGMASAANYCIDVGAGSNINAIGVTTGGTVNGVNDHNLGRTISTVMTNGNINYSSYWSTGQEFGGDKTFIYTSGITNNSAPAIAEWWGSAAATPTVISRFGGLFGDFAAGVKSRFGIFTDSVPFRLLVGAAVVDIDTSGNMVLPGTLNVSGKGTFPEVNGVLGGTTPAAATVTTLNASTSAKVGTNGTIYTQDLNCSGAITPASVGATTCAEQTFTIAACSGLATTDTLFVKQSTANTTLAYPVGDWRVSAAGVIARTYCNPTAGALTPTAQTLTIWARH